MKTIIILFVILHHSGCKNDVINKDLNSLDKKCSLKIKAFVNFNEKMIQAMFCLN